jgi:hypothetical protein
MQHVAQDKNELLPGPFISYSRQDLSFARKLYDALRERNRNAWVDLKGIEPSEEWLNKLYTAIDSTQAFVFVISEASVSSPYCEDEIRRANESRKKLIPILYRRVAPELLPPSLAKLQWISFQDGENFDTRMDDLVRALDTDLEWINEHTRLLVRAREWEREEQDNSYLLRGKDLKDAEQWLLETTQAKERQPTPLQSAFIGASAQAQRRSRNRLLAGSAPRRLWRRFWPSLHCTSATKRRPMNARRFPDCLRHKPPAARRAISTYPCSWPLLPTNERRTSKRAKHSEALSRRGRICRNTFTAIPNASNVWHSTPAPHCWRHPARTGR